MINLTSTSFTEIKKDILSFIAKNKDRYPIIDTYPGSVQNQIIELISGYATYTQYKHMRQRNETSILNAVLESSIYDKALELGYNPARAYAPQLRIRSVATEPLKLQKYQTIGSVQIGVNTFDLVYWGEERWVAYGQEFIVSVGKVRTIEGDFTEYNFNETVVLQPNQSKGMHVDNFLVDLSTSDNPSDPEQRRLSRLPEEFLAVNSALDITYWNSEATRPGITIWVANDVHGYGLPISKTDSFILRFLETSGKAENLGELVTTPNKISIQEAFVVVSVESTGSDGDTLDFISQIALTYGTTANRATSRLDWEIILSSHPLIKDAKFIGLDRGCCGVEMSYISESENVLTQAEVQSIQEYLEPRKLAGVPYTLFQAEPIILNLLAVVYYDCSAKPTSDSQGSFENRIRNQIEQAFLKEQFKINHKFNIRGIISEIGRIGYQDNPIISGVEVYEIDLTDPSPTPQPVPNEKVFLADILSYFKVNLDIELNCTPVYRDPITATCDTP